MPSPKQKSVPTPSSPPHPEPAGFSVRGIVSLPILDRTATFSRNHKIDDALQSRLSLFKRDLRKFGLSLSTVKQLVTPPRLEISPVPNNVDGIFEEFISSGTNQMAVTTSLSPRPEENLVALLKAGSTSTTPPSSTVNQEFTIRNVATLPALCYENDFTGTESHEIIIQVFDAITRKLRRVLGLPSTVLDAAAEFFDGLEMYPNMVEEKLPEDGHVASLREVFPEGTNEVLAIASLKRQYYDLLLGLLENGLSYETFPDTPVSSEDEFASEEIPPNSATSDSGVTTPNEAPSVPVETSTADTEIIISRLLERIVTLEHEYVILQNAKNGRDTDLENMKRGHADLQQSHANLKHENTSLKSENTGLASEKAKLKKLNEHLKNEKAKAKRDVTNLQSDKADLEKETEELKEENALLKEDLAEARSAHAAEIASKKEVERDLVSAQESRDKLLDISRAINRRSLLDKARSKLLNIHRLPDDYLHPDAKSDAEVPSPEVLSSKLRKSGGRTLSATAIRMIFGAEPTMNEDTMRRQTNRAAHSFTKVDVTEAVLANDITERQKNLLAEIYAFYWGHAPSS